MEAKCTVQGGVSQLEMRKQLLRPQDPTFAGEIAIAVSAGLINLHEVR